MPPLPSNTKLNPTPFWFKMSVLSGIIGFLLGTAVTACPGQSGTTYGPDTATTWVVNRLPTVSFDEDRPMETPHYTAEMPALPWEQARQCLMALHNPLDTLPDDWERMPRPTLIVIPHAAALIIHDHTLAGLAERDSVMLPYWLPEKGAFDAYSLIETHAIVVLEKLMTNERTLRHEALHFWLWYTRGAYGHPHDAFEACDRRYVARPVVDSTTSTMSVKP